MFRLVELSRDSKGPSNRRRDLTLLSRVKRQPLCTPLVLLHASVMSTDHLVANAAPPKQRLDMLKFRRSTVTRSARCGDCPPSMTGIGTVTTT